MGLLLITHINLQKKTPKKITSPKKTIPQVGGGKSFINYDQILNDDDSSINLKSIMNDLSSPDRKDISNVKSKKTYFNKSSNL